MANSKSRRLSADGAQMSLISFLEHLGCVGRRAERPFLRRQVLTLRTLQAVRARGLLASDATTRDLLKAALAEADHGISVEFTPPAEAIGRKPTSAEGAKFARSLREWVTSEAAFAAVRFSPEELDHAIHVVLDGLCSPADSIQGKLEEAEPERAAARAQGEVTLGAARTRRRELNSRLRKEQRTFEAEQARSNEYVNLRALVEHFAIETSASCRTPFQLDELRRRGYDELAEDILAELFADADGSLIFGFVALVTSVDLKDADDQSTDVVSRYPITPAEVEVLHQLQDVERRKTAYQELFRRCWIRVKAARLWLEARHVAVPQRWRSRGAEHQATTQSSPAPALVPASIDQVHEAIAFIYDWAERQRMHPPNVREVGKHAQIWLERRGKKISASAVSKEADKAPYKSRRPPQGRRKDPSLRVFALPEN